MKMRIILLQAILIIACNIVNSQEAEKPLRGKIGITYSFLGENDLFRTDELIGAASYYGEGFYTLGFSYISGLNKWLEAETGLEYSKHTFSVFANVPPNIDMMPESTNVSLLVVPVTVRANFLKYFFVNGGALLDMDISGNNSVDSQTGIGTVFGLGIKYDFKFGGSVFINPYAKAHSLLSFSGEDYPQRIYENGVRFGVTYQLNRAK